MDLLADWERAAARSGDGVRDEVESNRARVSSLRDPFTPIGRGEPGARDREVVLWEDAEVFVLVDLFCGAEKCLVIPKAPVCFPCDAPPHLLEHLGGVAERTLEAYRACGANGGKAWINPPAGITVRQLHVHVLPRWAAAAPSDKGALHARLRALLSGGENPRNPLRRD